MDNVELLVHISAPGTIVQDKKAVALAQACLDFRPMQTTDIMRFESDDYHQKQNKRLTAAAEPTSQHTLKRKANIQQVQPIKRSRVADNINPPYRNPFRGIRQQQPLQRSASDIPRPQTAPASPSDTIHVPRTGSERRRAYSDSFQNPNAPIQNSQDVDRVEESSEGRRSSPLARKGAAPDPMHAFQEDSMSSDPVSSSPRPKAAAPAKATPPSPDPTETVTATPSDPSQGLDGQRPYSSHPLPDKSPSIVTVSSSPSQRRPSQSRCTDGNDLVETQSPSPCSKTRQWTTPSTRRTPFNALNDLTHEVFAPQPLTGSMDGKSLVSRHMQSLVDELPVPKIFRPVRVLRDVRALERGHWLMEITIAPDAIVQEARASPSSARKMQLHSERFTGKTAQERLDQFWAAKDAGTLRGYDYGDDDAAVGLWTEKEFVEFWTSFSGLIKDGKAGWGARLVRDEIDPEASSPNEVDRRTMRVRVFHWGEIILHIYLAIYVCTHKVCLRIPMQWIAGNGTAIVETSGKKKYGGTTPFVQKGTPGEKDSRWGLIEA